jgi:hypothetical protein
LGTRRRPDTSCAGWRTGRGNSAGPRLGPCRYALGVASAALARPASHAAICCPALPAPWSPTRATEANHALRSSTQDSVTRQPVAVSSDPILVVAPVDGSQRRPRRTLTQLPSVCSGDHSPMRGGSESSAHTVFRGRGDVTRCCCPIRHGPEPWVDRFRVASVCHGPWRFCEPIASPRAINRIVRSSLSHSTDDCPQKENVF